MKPIVLLLVALISAGASTAVADDEARIAGVVLSVAGDPVAGAVVSLPELRRETTTDGDGRFVFENLPEGEYLVGVSSLRFGGAVVRTEASDGPADIIEITLDKIVHSGTVSVTAAGVARSLSELTTPVDLLVGDDLQRRKQSTLGETLAQQPGVTATSYGQGSSRPVIRGLGQDRIRILENGLDTGDVSSIGPDHAVSMDPLAAEQVEIVRGPATVLWGANAIGGVVNVLDGRVPDRQASAPVSGAVELEYGSNSEKTAGAVKLDGGGGRWAWHLDLYARDQDDYSSPASTSSGENGHHDDGVEEPEKDVIENSWAEAVGATLGGSYVTERGFVGIAFGGYRTDYGIPGHHHHEHDMDGQGEVEEEEGVHSELEQRRVDLHSQLDDPFCGFSALRLSAGWRDYDHEEIAGDEIGTRFENRWSEVRLDLLNQRVFGFEGTLGLQYVNRDFAAFGDEAFVAPTDTTKLGAFVFEQTAAEPVGFEFGLRYDDQDTRTSDAGLPDREFRTWTGSVGVVWDISDNWGLGASLNRPERAPTPEELYSNGPHAATFSYELGNPYLDPEVGNGLETSLRVTYDRFETTFSAFVTRYDGFIYLADTGEEIEGFEVLQFTQGDAEFKGFELHGHLEILHGSRSHLHLGFSRIPPRRGRLALIYMAERWDARIEGWWVDDQLEVAEHETPTPGYEMLNASVGYKIFSGRVVHEFLLRVRNLSNEVAYNHVSFLKYQAPLPGRDVSLVYRVLF
jgi:iron complex outermembrane receptor protein